MAQKINGSKKAIHFQNSEFSGVVVDDKKDPTNGHVQDSDYVIKHKTQITPHKSVAGKEAGKEEPVDDGPDISCGLGSLRTNIFGTRFANLYVFAICFALSNFFTSMVEQVIAVQLTSLERQFNIDNVRAGLFQTSSRVGFMSTVLFAGHFAKKSHIPLIIGACGVLQGLVLTIPAIMQLVDPFQLPILPSTKHVNSSEPEDFGDNAKYLCNTPFNGTNSSQPTNTTTGEVKQIQFIVVLVVQAAKGITDTFHNGFLPTLFMDDNLLDKSKMGIFLGLWQVISELSGPIGKQVNGMLTKVPIDLKDTDMDPKDRRFVAAWWLAFLVFGLGTAVFSVPIMLFPRKLISTRQRKEALAKAVLTFAGGKVDEEVAEADNTKTEDVEHVSAPAASVEDNAQDLSESKRRHYSIHNPHSRNNSRKGSRKRRDSDEGRYSGSRRPSLFPPVVGPTERKVSLAGDLVFQQPIKETDKKESVTDLIKDFPKALIRVLRKPVFVLLLVDVAIISVPLSGTSIFRNAYMANEYNVPMSEVALVSGITTAVGHIVGTIISSWISSKVKSRMGYMYIISSTYLLTLVIIPFYFVIGCGNEAVYGAGGEFGQPVNVSDCECSQGQQLIACGADGNNYYSPCYAGCVGVDGKDFTSCSVLNSTSDAKVTPGLCETDCHTNFILYASLQGVQYLFSSMAMIPRRLLILRWYSSPLRQVHFVFGESIDPIYVGQALSEEDDNEEGIVDPQDRGFATSLFMFCFFLMAIPSPNLFGKVIDDTCLIWDRNVCSLYDRDKIRYLMSGIDIGVHGCVQTTFILMMCIFKWDERRSTKKAEREAKNNAETNVEAADK